MGLWVVSEKVRTACPVCHGFAVKNGMVRGGQYMRCRECGHQFMADPARRRLEPEIRQLIKRLLAMGVPATKIAAAAKISPRQAYNLKKQAENG